MNVKVQALQQRLPDVDVGLDPASLQTFTRDASGLDGEAPCAIVKPRTVEELQRLVALARDLRLHLQPVSSGGQHHRGDTLCGPDTAIVDLGHFTRIIRIDRRNRVAMFEAAVQFPELQRAAAEQGLRAMLPLAARPGKSALAAYLEREPTIYPKFQWDASDPLLCTEVVFGTGEVFRTGSAAGPGTLEEQWAAGDAQKNPMGPGQSDLMRIVQGAQGTIGIATWCSAKCEPLPAHETLHVLGSEQLEPLVRVAYGILRRNHADILFLVDGNALTALLAPERHAYEVQRVQQAPWNLVYSLSAPQYFPEDNLRYVRREIGELTGQYGVREVASRAAVDALLRRLTRPDLTANLPYWKCAGLDATRELFFITTLDRVERFLPAVREATAAAGLGPDDVLTYLQPLVGGRMCHVEFDFPHAADAGTQRRINALVVELAWACRKLGAFFSRPYGPFTEVAFAEISSAWLVPKVKRIFDPDGILSPGCLHVPPHLRSTGGVHAQQ